MFSRALIGSLVATIASVPRRGCPDPAGRARVSGCRARRSGACQRGCRPRRIGNRGVPGESGRMTRWHSFCADRIARFRFLVLYDMRGSFRSITLHPHPVMRSRRTIVCSAPCVRRRLLPPHAGPDLAPSLPGCGQSPIRFPGVAVYSSRSCCSCLPALGRAPTVSLGRGRGCSGVRPARGHAYRSAFTSPSRMIDSGVKNGARGQSIDRRAGRTGGA